jgi:putative membrane protein
MIKYNPKNWISLIFHSYSRQVFRKLFPGLISIGALAGLICWVEIEIYDLRLTTSTVIHQMLGFVLGLFLVFRTNTAYDRWWEGRKQWGALVNNTRNLAIKVKAFSKDEDDHRFFKGMIPNFVLAMKEHLREGVIDDELIDRESWYDDNFASKTHKPNAIQLKLYTRLNEMLSTGRINASQFFVMDKEIKSFLDILGACERIRNTPIPYSYSMYMKKFIFIYVTTLPLGFVDTFHYWTIPVTMLVFYILVSVELIAEEIEDPFGKDENDLPTDDLSQKIKENVAEILE